MSSIGRRTEVSTCDRCGVVIEVCGFCQEEDCPDPLCYRCVRVALRQELPQPHVHGQLLG
jgi:hypothetical protein